MCSAGQNVMERDMKHLSGVVALTLMLTAPASAAIIKNGSFEQGKMAFNKDAWEVFDAPTGWSTVSGAGIEIQTAPTLGAVDAQNGARYVELDSHDNSVMRQVLNLAAGKYRLSFWYAPRIGNPETDGISYAIADLTGCINEAVNPVDGWTQVTAAFSTTGGAVNLDFAAMGESDHVGGLIDNMSIVPATIPVPAAGWMLFAALGGLGAMRRRKAKA